MKRFATYILWVILVIFISYDSDGQRCVDSVRLYGFSSPDYTFNHGDNVSCRFGNGQSAYVLGPLKIVDLRKSAAICIIDSAGKVVVTKSFTLPGQQKFGIVKLTADNSSRLVATGLLFSNITGIERAVGIIVIYLDSNLNVIWCKVLQANINLADDGEYYLNGLSVDINGRIFFSFYNDRDFTSIRRPVIFVALSSSGDLLWSKATPGKIIWDSDHWAMQRLPDAFSTSGKVFFLGQSQTDTVINTQHVARYGFTGLSFSADDGELIKASRSFLPSMEANIAEIGAPSTSIQSYFGDRFNYAFGEWVYRNNIDYPSMNCITFNTDTSFSISEVKRIKGFSSAYGQSRFSFNRNGDVAVVSTPSYNTVSVYNSNGRLLLNRKISPGILSQPYIRSIHFLDNPGYLRLTVVDMASPTFDMLMIDLPITGSNDIFSCLGGAGEQLATDTVPVESRTLEVSMISDVVISRQQVIQSNDIVLQEIEYCEIKSDCQQLTLSGESRSCTGKELKFEAHKSTGCFRNLVWSLDNVPATRTMNSDSSLTLVFQEPWSGYIHVSLDGCDLRDSLFVEISKDDIRPDLGSDKLWCGNNFALNTGNTFLSYQWQDGSTSEEFIVTGPGKYFVTVTDYCGQIYSDTVQVIAEKVSLLETDDTVLCVQQEIRLVARTGFNDYKWEPEYRLRNISETEVVVSPDIDTQYIITANTGQGCIIKDTILLKVVDCTAGLYVPSAFTPNGDGKNDELLPVVRGQIVQYEFSIYNRAGQLIFRSKTPGEGWAGRLANTLQNNDVYVWMCKVHFINQQPQLQKGTFILIR